MNYQASWSATRSLWILQQEVDNVMNFQIYIYKRSNKPKPAALIIIAQSLGFLLSVVISEVCDV